MISIENKNLDELAQNHYNFLCNTFSFSISKRLKVSLKKYESKKKDIYKDYKELLDYIQEYLRTIIIGNPKELENHKKELLKLSKNFEFTKKEKTHEQKEILKDLNSIFTYETFSSNGFSKKASKNEKSYFYSGNILVKNLNLSVCPYCNRNTIYSISNGKKRTSELDHFYPQGKYPYFALSFYNLIPSCKVCNKIKLDKDDKEYINPYDNRFNMNKNNKFTMLIKDVTFFYDTKGFSIGRKFISSISKEEQKRINNNIKDFKLYDLYQNHKDIVLELIQKREIYPDSYIDDLLQEYEGSLFNNREDIFRLITCGYVEDKDLHKRPLSKLIKDISEELELI